MRKKHAYDRGRAAFVYEEWMRRSIAQYKYGGRREYAEFYAEEILLACAREMIRWKAEVLVPIPLHPSRQRKRGYNQAELLAAKLSIIKWHSNGCGLPYKNKKNPGTEGIK